MRTRPVPEPTEISQPFWDAARRGELRVQHCLDCGHRWWTPQAACTACWSESWEWAPCSGRASLYSWSVVHRPADPEAFGDEIPYVVAVVQLEEGPHMLTNVVGCPPEQLRAEMPLEVAFEPISEEIHLYKFRPSEATR